MIEAPEETLPLDELKPQIIESEPQTTLVEKLESFSANPQDSAQALRIGKSLPLVIKEELKNFLRRNLDVFAWRHEDMVGIGPKFNFHHLIIKPIYTLYR